MNDCVFCKIAAGEIPCDAVLENDYAICFRDLNPQAPNHVLVVPREHMSNISECAARNDDLLGKLFRTANEVAVKEGLSGGFRVVTNCGKDACQSVDHFHIHVLGGKELSPQLG